MTAKGTLVGTDWGLRIDQALRGDGNWISGGLRSGAAWELRLPVESPPGA